jgi:YbgC/YbaW family acyl-CoA thioester hydrolase
MVFKSTFRVHWVDTDIAGVMHYSNFFRYFEACEEEFYRSQGAALGHLREKYRIMLPRVEAHCVYKSACKFDDLIEVVLKVRDVESKTVTYDFQLYRKEENQLAAEGFLKCIAVDKNWKVVPLPVEIAKILRENM